MMLREAHSLSTELAHPFLDKNKRKIRSLFDGIAPRYDFLNHLLSLNLDRGWRKRLRAWGRLHRER